MDKRHLLTAVIAAVVIWMTLMAWVAIQILFPARIDYPTQPIPVLLGAPLHAGGTLTLRVERCGWKLGGRPGDRLPYRASRTVVDDATGDPAYVYDGGAPSSAPYGCETVTSGLTTLPAQLAPGTYRLVGTTTVDGGHTTAWQTAPFTVEPE
jgi:hypothetical protein